MIIELCGLIASGKTTAAKQLRQQLKGEMISLNGRRELIYYSFIFLLKFPRFYFYTLFLIFLNSNWRSFYLKFVNLLLYKSAVYAKAGEYSLAIIDEGWRQNVLSIFDQPASEEQIRKYLRLSPPVDLVIVVEVSEKERERREKFRQKPRRRPWLSVQAYELWQKVMKENFYVMLRVLKEDGRLFFELTEDKQIDDLLNFWQKYVKQKAGK